MMLARVILVQPLLLLGPRNTSGLREGSHNTFTTNKALDKVQRPVKLRDLLSGFHCRSCFLLGLGGNWQVLLRGATSFCTQASASAFTGSFFQSVRNAYSPYYTRSEKVCVIFYEHCSLEVASMHELASTICYCMLCWLCMHCALELSLWGYLPASQKQLLVRRVLP